MAAVVEVWSVDLERAVAGPLSADYAARLLSDEDREKAVGLVNARDASQRLAATLALRLLLEGVIGPQYRKAPFTRGPAGKPALAGAPCHFSLSHIPGRALIAISASPVGVDIERLRTTTIEEVRRQRIESFAVQISSGAPLPSGPPELRFLQAWTRLEASAKVDGRGIGRLLTEIGVVGAGRRLADAGQLPVISPTAMALSDVCSALDLTLGDGLVGAVAGACGMHLPGAVQDMPTDAEGLAALQQLRRDLA
jgi:4'-phosphopantetheinyl transferase